MTKRRVMIVDDDEAVRSLLAGLVEQEGYEAFPADSAKSAISLASREQITAFLLCMDSPEINGPTLCRTIRGMADYKLVPIIFVAGTNSNLTEAFAAGCDDLINKPIDPLVLRARLNGHIQRTESFQQLDRTRKILDQYLSKRTREVAEIAAQTGVLPSPEQREVVILFTDIRGFTA